MNLAVLYGVAAGLCVAVIGPMNAGLQGKMGLWGMNAWVHFVGLVFCLGVFFATGSYASPASSTPAWYSYFGGIFGAMIVVLMVLGITRIGVSSTLVLSIASQLLLAALIDHFALLGQARASLTQLQLIGLVLVCLGAYLVVAKPSVSSLTQAKADAFSASLYSEKGKIDGSGTLIRMQDGANAVGSDLGFVCPKQKGRMLTAHPSSLAPDKSERKR